MQYFWLLIFVIVYFCSSCDRKGEGRHILNCNHRVLVHSDSCILGRPYQIALSDSIVLIADSNNEKMLYAFHAKSGKEIGRYLTRGQGPNEYLSISSIGRWKDGMYLYDVNKRVTSEIICKDSIRIVPTMNLGKDLHPTFVPLADDTFIASGYYQEGRFCLLTDSGRRKEYLMEYPSRDEEEKTIANQAKSQAYSGGIVACPSGNVFMAYTSKADMLSFYGYENGNIQVIKEIYKTYPDYHYDSKNKRYLAISRKNPFTYIWGCGTSKYVYLMYSGKSYDEAGDFAHRTSQIEVYNWRGIKEKTLLLDIPILGMAVSEDDSTMYAISMNPEPQIVAFDL